MGRVIDISEIVGTFGRNGVTAEVCATAVGEFDEEAGQLRVALDSFVRPVDVRARETHEAASWLPGAQTVTEHISREEAGSVSREVFHRWAARVRAAVPSELKPHFQ